MASGCLCTSTGLCGTWSELRGTPPYIDCTLQVKHCQLQLNSGTWFRLSDTDTPGADSSWAVEPQKTWNSCVLYSRDFISPGGKVAVFEVLRALYMKIKVFYCMTTYQLVDREVVKERGTSIFRVHVARETLLGLLMHYRRDVIFQTTWILHT